MSETWIEADALAEELHCSKRQLEEFKAQRIFKPGHHFYGIGINGRRGGKHVYCLERCRETLLSRTAAKAAAERKAAKAITTYDTEHLDQLIKETQQERTAND